MVTVAEFKSTGEPTNDCSCNTCKAACSYKPGWMKPTQAEEIAKHLNISLEELFKTKLMVDFWNALEEANGEDVFLLSPAIVGRLPGTVFPANPKGECVFFKDGLCGIHAVKPFECREYDHTLKAEASSRIHHEIAISWVPHQAQIESLLGEKPEAYVWSIFDEGGFGSFFGGGS